MGDVENDFKYKNGRLLYFLYGVKKFFPVQR